MAPHTRSLPPSATVILRGRLKGQCKQSLWKQNANSVGFWIMKSIARLLQFAMEVQIWKQPPGLSSQDRIKQKQVPIFREKMEDKGDLEQAGSLWSSGNAADRQWHSPSWVVAKCINSWQGKFVPDYALWKSIWLKGLSRPQVKMTLFHPCDISYNDVLGR